MAASRRSELFIPRSTAAALGNSAVEATRKDYYCTAVDFRQALENDFSGAFSDIVFAVTD
jgi:hypothetical protein